MGYEGGEEIACRVNWEMVCREGIFKERMASRLWRR